MQIQYNNVIWNKCRFNRLSRLSGWKDYHCQLLVFQRADVLYPIKEILPWIFPKMRSSIPKMQKKWMLGIWHFQIFGARPILRCEVGVFFQGKGYILNLEKSRFTREDSPTAQPTEAYTKVDDYIHVGRQGGKAQPWGVLVGPVTRGKTTGNLFFGGWIFSRTPNQFQRIKIEFQLIMMHVTF